MSHNCENEGKSVTMENNAIQDPNFSEKIEPVHTWGNGAKSFYVEKEFTAMSTIPKEGSKVCLSIGRERLKISKTKSGYSFTITSQRKDLFEGPLSLTAEPTMKDDPMWININSDSGISLTKETAKKVLEIISGL